MSVFPLENLPEEVIFHIFDYLKVKDLLNCGQVSTQIRRIARDQKLWQRVDLNGGFQLEFLHIRPINLHPNIQFIRWTWYFFSVWNFKKIRYKIWGWKNRVQKTGPLLFKKRRGSLTLFFTPCFLHPRILHPIFFSVAKWPIFSKQESWVQIDSASM